MGKKVGVLIKEARAAAGLTQEQLAQKVEGVTVSAISKAERGEAELTQEALKKIAKATGVTQASLLKAARGEGKKSTGKTTVRPVGKTASVSGKAARKTTGKTTGKASGKTTELKLTATEKNLVQLYRKADSGMKKMVISLLKGEKPEAGDLLETLVGGAINMLGGKK